MDLGEAIVRTASGEHVAREFLSEMAAVKAADVGVATYWVNCPHCGTEQAEPRGGSLMWDNMVSPSEVYTCPDCGGKYKIPRKVL